MIPTLPPQIPMVAVATTIVQTSGDWFTGTMTSNTEDGPTTLILRKEADGSVSGKLSVGGTSATLRGLADAKKVTGTANLGEASVPFTLTREGATAKLSFADEEIEFTLFSSEGTSPRPAHTPIAKTTIAKNTEELPTPTNGRHVPQGWKTYSNPIGLTFRYPSTWTLTDINGPLRLIPPGGTQNVSDIYAFVAMPVPGIDRADDPRLLPLADNMVGQMFPYMRRTSINAIQVGGKGGVVVTYDGNNPSTGKASRIRSQAVVHQGVLLQLQSWGDAERTSAHDATLRQMFLSLTFGQEQRDLRIVGNWSGGASDGSRIKQDGAGKITSGISSQSSSGYQLMLDGTLLAQTTSRSIVSISSSHSIPESQRVDASVDTGDRTEWKKGRWYAGNGKIAIVMEDGTGMTVPYQLEGTTLIIRFADGTSLRFNRR